MLIYLLFFSQALLDTWKLACASPSRTKVVVPKGTYKITQATMEGPCRAPIEFNLQGTLQAPALGAFKSSENWIMFQHIDHLTVSGSGTFDGNGKTAWGKKCEHTSYCGSLPIVSSLSLSLKKCGTYNDGFTNCNTNSPLKN